MENIANRVDIRLAKSEKQADKWLARPAFKKRTIFNENLAAVHMRKMTLFYNNAIYVGITILDRLKSLMYDFHYDVIKEKYGDNAVLQYTDTDSLIYSITTDNIYNDMKEIIDYFDTSDYAPDNPYGMPLKNKKVIGKIKDELNGHNMKEFIGLRAKMYAINIDDFKVIKKAKGVKKKVVNDKLIYEDYRRSLIEKAEIYKKMNSIRSYKHNVYSIERGKKSLSCHDDKRYVIEDGIRTLPRGHKDILNDKMIQMEVDCVLDVE